MVACLHRVVFIALVYLLGQLPAHAAEATPLLYEVKSDTNTVYLFGTIHVGASSMYPLNASVNQAFDKAGVLALEADPTDQNALVAAMSMALYPPPDNLERHITPALYARVKAALPAVGIPLDYARNLRPHLLAMLISITEVQRLGYEPTLGLDVHFATLAKASGKPIVQLESMAQQMELFNNLPPEAQEGMLQATLDSISEGRSREELDELVTAWSHGDPDAILRAIQREFEGLDAKSAQRLQASLYDERNRSMADDVEAMLRGSRPHFVAIGAGHLVGATGLPILLTRKGYRVRRL